MTTAIAVTDEKIRESLLDIRKSVKNARGAIESNQVVDKDVHGTLTRVLSKIDAALDTLHSAALTSHGEEAAATPAPQHHLRVKPLEWDGEEGSPGRDTSASPDPYHTYHVRHLSEGHFDVILNTDLGSLWFGSQRNEWHDGYAKAKAAAQADYERRILSALASAPEVSE
jgi:hypothetical protein